MLLRYLVQHWSSVYQLAMVILSWQSVSSNRRSPGPRSGSLCQLHARDRSSLYSHVQTLGGKIVEGKQCRETLEDFRASSGWEALYEVVWAWALEIVHQEVATSQLCSTYGH